MKIWSNEELKRRLSLKKNRDFSRLYRQGKSVGAKYAVLVYKKANHNSLRFGFSVSKKVGNAVIRNQVRRRMKEAVRALMPGILRSHSMIFVARAQIAACSYAQVYACMQSLLQRAKLI